MRKIITIILMIVVFACSAVAGPISKETFFGTCIDERILKCEKKSVLLNSASEGARTAGERAHRELVFLQNNREALIKEMIGEDLPMKRHKIDYFLIKTFVEGPVNLAKNWR